MLLTTVPARQMMPRSVAGRGGPSVDLERTVVVGVQGDVDIYTAPALLRTLQDLMLSPSGSRGEVTAAGLDLVDQVLAAAVVVDLTAVEFIDSSAIGVLDRGHHLARSRECGYALVAIHPMIHTLFAITGLAQVLPLHPDVLTAVAALTGRQ